MGSSYWVHISRFHLDDVHGFVGVMLAHLQASLFPRPHTSNRNWNGKSKHRQTALTQYPHCPIATAVPSKPDLSQKTDILTFTHRKILILLFWRKLLWNCQKCYVAVNKINPGKPTCFDFYRLEEKPSKFQAWCGGVQRSKRQRTLEPGNAAGTVSWDGTEDSSWKESERTSEFSFVCWCQFPYLSHTVTFYPLSPPSPPLHPCWLTSCPEASTQTTHSTEVLRFSWTYLCT